MPGESLELCSMGISSPKARFLVQSILLGLEAKEPVLSSEAELE